jgi:hypothetical protein|tara:strand:+ start:381 stop:611 length:231 start_codon:yes stop_codon:yes gene_type:complete
MKLTNYNGTKATEKAYNIQETINLVRNETIPRLQENYFDLSDEENVDRIANLRNYVKKLQYDLGIELGNDQAYENL